jgi:hypothetical protein
LGEMSDPSEVLGVIYDQLAHVPELSMIGQ